MLRNPLVVAACPLSAQLDTLQRMEDLGAAAAVMPSLFEEQIEKTEIRAVRLPRDAAHPFHDNSFFYRRLDGYNGGPNAYLRHIELAKKSASIPVIGSLNGTTDAGWIQYARLMQEAGADAIELNMYHVAADPTMTTEQVESRYLELVAAVRSAISIPLAVKLGPYFAAFANMAQRLVAAGAGGLVMFNRFLQPDIDTEKGEVVTRWKYSTPGELSLPLRWIAILKGHVPASLAATGGIHRAQDLVKAIMAGADVGMVASVLYQQGIGAIGPLLRDLEAWLDQSDFHSVEQLKGILSQKNCPNPEEFERALYAKSIAETTEGVT